MKEKELKQKLEEVKQRELTSKREMHEKLKTYISQIEKLKEQNSVNKKPPVS